MILLPIIDDLALARPKQQYIWLTIFGQELLQKTKTLFPTVPTAMAHGSHQ